MPTRRTAVLRGLSRARRVQDFGRTMPDPAPRARLAAGTARRGWQLRQSPRACLRDDAVNGGSGHGDASSRWPEDRDAGMWLLDRCHAGGGFFASDRAGPDLLSTATALHALSSLHCHSEGSSSPALDFVDSSGPTARFYGTGRTMTPTVSTPTTHCSRWGTQPVKKSLLWLPAFHLRQGYGGPAVALAEAGHRRLRPALNFRLKAEATGVIP